MASAARECLQRMFVSDDVARGSWQSIHTRFRTWALDGTFVRMLAGVWANAEAAGDIDWLVSVGSTIVRAHQHAAGGKGGAEKRTNHKITPSAEVEVD